MSAYGSIGFTRRSRTVERLLSLKERQQVREIESIIKSLQAQQHALYENDDLEDDEMYKLLKPLEAEVEAQIDKLCAIKYTTR